MAKLFLKYDQAVLKEVTLSQAACTIGRLPDNAVQIDNLAVSGHHAKIYWDQDKYVIEDNNSLNGTYVNNVRINRHTLRDGDSVLIGKHTLAYKEEWQAGKPVPPAAAAASGGPAVPKLEETVVLDTKKRKEMLASTPGASSPAPAAGSSPTHKYAAPPAPIDRIGQITILDGKTDQHEYLLTAKMSVIGKSEMATIKLKGWFAPKMAALISKRDNGYVIAASEKDTKVKVNGEEIAGQKALSEGDVIEVAGVKMSFGLQ
jgi:predicted component of type VI protein secretion system